MKTVNAHNSRLYDCLRQVTILISAPLIWIASSLGVFLDSARSPSEFSDLSDNLLVPYPLAFSIWLPIFLGILVYGVIQALRVNQRRALFRETGWWIAAGLWGIVAWSIATAYLTDSHVELSASLIFIPTMIVLVIAMVRMFRRKAALDSIEKWFVLLPISLIAGWCSIAVFIGLNGLIWNTVEPLGWNAIWTAILILSIALVWIIVVLIRGAKNRAYAAPVVWGLGFLAFRHLSDDGEPLIGIKALIGICAIMYVCSPLYNGKRNKCLRHD